MAQEESSEPAFEYTRGDILVAAVVTDLGRALKRSLLAFEQSPGQPGAPEFEQDLRKAVIGDVFKLALTTLLDTSNRLQEKDKQLYEGADFKATRTRLLGAIGAELLLAIDRGDEDIVLKQIQLKDSEIQDSGILRKYERANQVATEAVQAATHHLRLILADQQEYRLHAPALHNEEAARQAIEDCRDLLEGSVAKLFQDMQKAPRNKEQLLGQCIVYTLVSAYGDMMNTAYSPGTQSEPPCRLFGALVAQKGICCGYPEDESHFDTEGHESSLAQQLFDYQQAFDVVYDSAQDGLVKDEIFKVFAERGRTAFGRSVKAPTAAQYDKAIDKLTGFYNEMSNGFVALIERAENKSVVPLGPMQMLSTVQRTLQ
jgi:hypothetical protein